MCIPDGGCSVGIAGKVGWEAGMGITAGRHPTENLEVSAQRHTGAFPQPGKQQQPVPSSPHSQQIIPKTRCSAQFEEEKRHNPARGLAV